MPDVQLRLEGPQTLSAAATHYLLWIEVQYQFSKQQNARTVCYSFRLAKQGNLMPLFWHSYLILRQISMARSANPLPSEDVTLSLNSQTAWYLDRLVETGLYGNNRAEAARVILYDHCKLLIADQKLVIAPTLPSTGGAFTPS
jgi:hypothetical protein